MQDVFELKFAKMPDESSTMETTPPGLGYAKSEGRELATVSTDDESDNGSVSEEEREKRIQDLQQLVGSTLFLAIFCLPLCSAAPPLVRFASVSCSWQWAFPVYLYVWHV